MINRNQPPPRLPLQYVPHVMFYQSTLFLHFHHLLYTISPPQIPQISPFPTQLSIQVI